MTPAIYRRIAAWANRKASALERKERREEMDCMLRIGCVKAVATDILCNSLRVPPKITNAAGRDASLAMG